jgi:hypothetical protein
MIKKNFGGEKIDKIVGKKLDSTKNEEKSILKEEWEDFIVKSGAKGSFMIYRSTKKDDELGLDEI